MTILLVDPLKLYTVKGKGPLRARLIVQVCSYDETNGVLITCQAANFRLNGDFNDVITYQIDVSGITEQLDTDSTSEGYIVDLGVFFDGENAVAFECQSVSPECLFMPDAALTMSQLSLLPEL